MCVVQLIDLFKKKNEFARSSAGLEPNTYQIPIPFCRASHLNHLNALSACLLHFMRKKTELVWVISMLQTIQLVMVEL